MLSGSDDGMQACSRAQDITGRCSTQHLLSWAVMDLTPQNPWDQAASQAIR